jgi:hypothetical protein
LSHAPIRGLSCREARNGVANQLDADDQHQHGHDHGVVPCQPGLLARIREENVFETVDDAVDALNAA